MYGSVKCKVVVVVTLRTYSMSILYNIYTMSGKLCDPLGCMSSVAILAILLFSTTTTTTTTSTTTTTTPTNTRDY